MTKFCVVFLFGIERCHCIFSLRTLYRANGVLNRSRQFRISLVGYKGPSKRGHIVTDTLLLMMFLGRANARDTK